MVFFGCLAKAVDLEPKPDSDHDKHNNNKNANNISKFKNAIVINYPYVVPTTMDWYVVNAYCPAICILLLFDSLQ